MVTLKNSAVLVVDVQNDYCHQDGILGKVFCLSRIQEALPRMKLFLDAMRSRQVPIVHIQMTEDSTLVPKNMLRKRNQAFGSPLIWELAIPGTWGHELMMDVCEGERVFAKNTFDAFSNEALHSYLQESGVEHVIVIGGYTYACVESTVRSAVTHGYHVTIAQDLVGAPDELYESHVASLKVLGMQFARVVDSESLVRI